MTENAPHYVRRQERPPSVVSSDDKVDITETGEKQLDGEFWDM